MHLGKHKFEYRNSVIRIVEFIDPDSEETRYCTDSLTYSYESLDSLVSDYKKLRDKQLKPKRVEEDNFDEKTISYRGHELELERDIKNGKIRGGHTYNLYSQEYPGCLFTPLVQFKGKLKDLQNQFEKYVDDYYNSIKEEKYND